MGKERRDDVDMARSRSRCKPKRAPTAYIIFMTEFMRQQCLESREDAQRALIAGAKIWRNMSCDDRDKYYSKANKGRARYIEEIGCYKKELKSLKAPPRPFAAFLRDHYYSDDFQDTLEEAFDVPLIPFLARSAANAWYDSEPNVRQDYTQEFICLYHDYKLHVTNKCGLGCQFRRPFADDTASTSSTTSSRRKDRLPIPSMSAQLKRLQQQPRPPRPSPVPPKTSNPVDEPPSYACTTPGCPYHDPQPARMEEGENYPSDNEDQVIYKVRFDDSRSRDSHRSRRRNYERYEEGY